MTPNRETKSPAKAERVGDSSLARAAARRSRPGPILIVEDNRDAAAMLRELLALEGHEAAIAYSGDRALKLARELEPELILCDVGLPDIDGYSLAPALRAALASKPAMLVAVTGYARPEDEARARAAGFDAHLAKPVDLAALGRVLAQRGAARA